MDVEEEVRMNFSLMSAEGALRACRACFAEPARECFSTEAEADAAPPELLALAAFDSKGRVRLCERCARDLRAGCEFRRRCLQSEALLRAKVEPGPADDDRADARDYVETELDEDERPKAEADDDDKPHACRLCPRAFKKRQALAVHAAAHAGRGRRRPDDNECRVCSKRFSKLTSLADHMTTHTGERPYACAVCAKSFAFKSTLYGHAKTHTGERAFQCGECGKTFARSTHLRRHALTHAAAAERRHRCAVCAKAFLVKAGLDSHMTIHTGERPFACAVCSKAFASKKYLACHAATHGGDGGKPFRCRACPKAFARKQYLANHVRGVHTGERPYACARCGEAYAQSDRLRRHRARAHGERETPPRGEPIAYNFVCDACGAGFTYRSSMIKHANGAYGCEATRGDRVC